MLELAPGMQGIEPPTSKPSAVRDAQGTANLRPSDQRHRLLGTAAVVARDRNISAPINTPLPKSCCPHSRETTRAAAAADGRLKGHCKCSLMGTPGDRQVGAPGGRGWPGPGCAKSMDVSMSQLNR